MDVTVNAELKDILVGEFNKSPQSKSPILSSLRKEAILYFEKAGFPSIKNEEWKYSNISPVLKKDFSPAGPATLKKSALQLGEDKFQEIVLINGRYSEKLSDFSNESIDILTFDNTPENLLQKYLKQEAIHFYDGFTALNTSLSEGLFIRIKKGKAIEIPIAIRHINDTGNANIIVNSRILISCEENAQAKLVEFHENVGINATLENSITQIALSRSALIDYYKIQSQPGLHYHVGTTQVYLEEKSNFNATTITLEGEFVRNNLNIVLNSEYSEATLFGLSMIDNKKHVDNHTLVDHAKANCYSNELYKSLLDGNSTGVFNGKIFVKPDAQKTNAFQSNKNILLSKDATMNAKPQLEIFADDVKCSHGATIGKLDEEPLFYLRARGISEKKAKALLVHAFAGEILEHIKLKGLKSLLDEQILERLN
ncbi:MAG: Fe-S cluster assembly protein SufD [Cytophagaceae bacterium]